jgi:uncharacterized protein (DUF433 family)
MINEFEVVSIPLETNEQGVIRVSGTRVSLDSILHAYYEGATAEEIVLRFPTCTIENIYTIISWALNNPGFVNRYLQEQTARLNQLEQEIRQEYPSPGLRDRLLARSQINNKPQQ